MSTHPPGSTVSETISDIASGGEGAPPLQKRGERLSKTKSMLDRKLRQPYGQFMKLDRLQTSPPITG